MSTSAGAPRARGIGPEPSMPVPLELAFAPIHKGAFGVAVGLVAGLLIALVTAFHVIVQPPSPDLGLLSHYFYGYSVSWQGVVIGLGWGCFTGFVAGWFLAFVRNFALAVQLTIIRVRADLSQSFLDHI